jgi:hypothetical protein
MFLPSSTRDSAPRQDADLVKNHSKDRVGERAEDKGVLPGIEFDMSFPRIEIYLTHDLTNNQVMLML